MMNYNKMSQAKFQNFEKIPQPTKPWQSTKYSRNFNPNFYMNFQKPDSEDRDENDISGVIVGHL